MAQIPLSFLRVGLPVLALVAAVWLALLWRPSRQVELHTETLLARVSARDWPAVRGMMTPDYSDPWGNDRESAVDGARELLSQFFALHIVAIEPPGVSADGDSGRASARVGVFGSGTGVAHAVMDEVQALREPFVFRWRKSGPWPWDWGLVSLGQREIEARFPGGMPTL